MTKARKWASPLTGIGIVIGWWALTVALYGVSATLYAGGKMSADSFSTSTRLFFGALLLPIIPVLAFLVYWYRRNLRIAWGYVWPALVVAVIVAVPAVAALSTSSILLTLLAVVVSTSLVHMLSARILERREPWSLRRREPWEYDFTRHLRDQTTKEYATGPPGGKVVKVVTNARSGTDMEQAIFEHPADQGDTIIEYVITGIDRAVTAVKLHGIYGIMEQFTDDDGKVKVSRFPHSRGNRVRFEIRVNRQVVFQDDIGNFGWRQLKVDPFTPQEGSLTVEFRTNNMGDPSWNWAAWSELKLVEQV